ncbi:biopolymer transporter ExbD [Mesobaculum littorinae]|uniref:Biopolymer transporter ExbD n=1 Tax=Mesobaculum littorinae TaxID=2486419 RepID=A0A438AIN7_9RHOB|nr:biopolymer transporter ExbD [Mesobaculum littorinae]RVV98560.1 biopolymer transporter ExbD [Mesobaculum littorinae]
MAIPKPRPRSKGEPTIALINIVFLMLIFFLIAGSLAPPLDGRVELADAEEIAGRAPPDALVALADGTLLFRGEPVTPETALDLLPEAERGEDGAAVRVVPDRDLPATDLVALSAALRRAGAEEVWIVTRRGLE